MSGAKTEEKQYSAMMEEALRHSEERFRALVENIQDMVVQLDRKGRLVYAGPAVKLITGYTPEELLGRPTFDFICAEDVPKVRKSFNYLLSQPPGEERLTTPLEHGVVTKEGEIRHVETLASVLRDATGEAMGLICTVRDITERKRREEQLEALTAAGATLTSTLELEPLLDNILAAAIQAIPAAEKGSIMMLDEASGELSFRALAGYSDPRIWDERFPRERGYSARAVREQRPLLIADAHADPSVVYDGDIEEMIAVQSAAVVPLLVKGRPIGVISLDNASRRNAFDADDLRTLVLFADRAAIAIENARLFAAEQRRADDLEILFEAAQATAGSLELDHILQWLVEALGRRFNASICSISLFNPRDQTFEVCAVRARRDAPTLPTGGKIPISRAPALQLLAESKTSVFASDFDDASKESWMRLISAGEREILRQHDIHSVLSMPLIHRGEFLGAVTLRLRESLPQMPLEQQTLVETVAGHAAVAIANARLHQQTRQRNLALQILQQVSLDISARLAAPDLLQTITEKAVALLGAEAGGFYLYDPDRDELTFSVACGYYKEFIGATLKPGEGLCGRAFQERQAVMAVENYHTWEGRAEAFAEDERLASILAVPLTGRRGVLGVLEISGNAGQPAFDEQDIWLVELFAAQATVAIENAQLHQDTVQMTQDLRHVHDLGLALSATLDVRQIMRLLARSAREVTGAVISHVYVRGEETDNFLTELDSDEPERWAPSPLVPPRSDGLTVEVMRSGQPVNIPETSGDPRVKSRLLEVGLHSTMGVPLIREGKAIGALFVNGERPGQFSARQLELLSVLATQAAIAVENARLVGKLVRSERLAAIGQIGVAVSHEINNALTPVLGNADFLLKREADCLSPEAREALAAVVGGARRIRGILQKLREPEDRLTKYLGETDMIDIT
jgi:PAS domain S-box-containing protein